MVFIGVAFDKVFKESPSIGSSTLPGDSGGPLLDKNGRIAGIVSTKSAEEDVKYSRFVNLSRPELAFIAMILTL